MEKLKLINHNLIVDFDRIESKINEIIDHLNSQDQEEVKNPEYDGIREVERQKLKNIVDTVNKRYPRDTPKQKEEWEFDLRNLMYRDGEQLRSAGEGKPYTGEYRELVVSMIKNLLLEREKEAYFKGKEYQAKLDRDCYGVSFEKLDKLTTK
jgi:hypothetical protein